MRPAADATLVARTRALKSRNAPTKIGACRSFAYHAKATLQTATFHLAGDRAVRLAVNLRCPRCGAELKAGDVAADHFSVVMVCAMCDYNILTVS